MGRGRGRGSGVGVGRIYGRSSQGAVEVSGKVEDMEARSVLEQRSTWLGLRVRVRG